MNRQCPGITRSGDRCTQRVQEGEYHCYWHNPQNEGKRRRIASKGGKGNRAKLSKDLHARLDELIEQVVGGEIEPYPASVCGSLIKVKIALVEMERKLRETEDLANRLEEMEELVERQKRRGA